VTDVSYDLGNGTFLNTRENLAKSRNGGLELVANGKLTPKLTYNVSGNAYWNEIRRHSGRPGHRREMHDPVGPRQRQLPGHAEGLLPAERLHLGQATDAPGL
jgi:outer membrane receptor protein involved in Fe transport